MKQPACEYGIHGISGAGTTTPEPDVVPCGELAIVVWVWPDAVDADKCLFVCRRHDIEVMKNGNQGAVRFIRSTT